MIWWSNYVRCECKNSSRIPQNGPTNFNTEWDDKFISLGDHMYTSHSSSMVDLIYTCVISNAWRLMSLIDAAREQMRRCVSFWEIGVIAAKGAAR